MDAALIVFSVIAPVAVVFALFLGVIVLIVSAILRTSPRGGLVAIAWSMPITVVAAVVAAVVASGNDLSNVLFWVLGAVLTFGVARRGGYRTDAIGWILLLLGPIGWFVALWRRNGALARGRATATA